MIWATEYKHVELVKLLLSKNADPNIRDKVSGDSFSFSFFKANTTLQGFYIKSFSQISLLRYYAQPDMLIVLRHFIA